MLEAVKTALRITATEFDGELCDLIESAKEDLKIPGVVITEETPSIIRTAIITYCKIHFGEGRADLKDSYNEQKAQLAMCSSYNGRGESNG